ncbi:T9SS type A sorting domain-containing protein, partial [candidate division WOR-3 bacterium]|nr:T9SS type A sorting domain-containing protein [candidate division WOR-3 bacterium]
GEMEDSIDIFPDILLSRVPVSNRNDINNFLNKIITLKSTTGDTVLMVASYLDASTDGSIAMENIIKHVDIDEPIKKLYEKDGNLSSATYINSINNSPFIISHNGHGNTSSIQSGIDYTSKDQMDGLTNSIPTLLYSLSCWSAAYDDDCFAEHFLLSQGGGFYIGNSRYGWYTPYYPGFGTGDLYNLMFFNYFINSVYNPSAALNDVYCDLSYQIIHFNDYRWAFFVLTYFGDPLINMYRNIDNIPLNTQTAVKNTCLSFTIPVYDSINITVTGDSIASKSLYPHDNLFSCPIYNDDSLIIHIASINSPDTNITVYTYISDTIAYLTSYNCNYLTSDTLQLDLNVSPGFSGNFLIKPLNITDTLLFIACDSFYNLANDTILHFYFEINELPVNNSQIPIILDNDTLYLQLGNNFKSNIDISLLPDKIHYSNLDTIKPIITVKNTAKYTSNNLEMIIKSTALNYLDTIIIDSILPEQIFEYTDTLIADTSQNFADISITIGNGIYEKSNLFYISLNSNPLFNDFETGDNYTIDSSTAFFHLSTIESMTGSLSYFSGYATTSSYPSQYATTLYSPPFIYDTSTFLGFDTKYHVEAGFDYCIVYLESGSIELQVTTLSGESFGWEQYIFPNTKYNYAHGTETRLCFSFYSENDACQFEGWYIDDVLLPGTEFYTGISVQPGNSTSTYNYNIVNKINYDNSTNTIYLNLIGNKYNYSIYDITGRIVNKGILIGNNNHIKTNFSSGKYFLRIKSFDTDIIKSFTIIR